jgi:hypothetical protein
VLLSFAGLERSKAPRWWRYLSCFLCLLCFSRSLSNLGSRHARLGPAIVVAMLAATVAGGLWRARSCLTGRSLQRSRGGSRGARELWKRREWRVMRKTRETQRCRCERRTPPADKPGPAHHRSRSRSRGRSRGISQSDIAGRKGQPVRPIARSE